MKYIKQTNSTDYTQLSSKCPQISSSTNDVIILKLVVQATERPPQLNFCNKTSSTDMLKVKELRECNALYFVFKNA
jgi:hypothetical protein